MVPEDVVEEHNGVYTGKWHIVSPEGLDLPEGLKYLKNSWEGDECNWIYRYIPTISVERIQLKTLLKRLMKLCLNEGSL